MLPKVGSFLDAAGGLGCSLVESCLFQDLSGACQRVKAHGSALAKMYICIDLLTSDKLHKVQVGYVGQTRAQLRICKFLPKSRMTRRLPSTEFVKDVPPSASNAGFVRTPHTKECGTVSSLLCISSHDLYTLLQTANYIIILGDSQTVWDAVTESEVRFQVITLKKY
jgi:hypothetical protein